MMHQYGAWQKKLREDAGFTPRSARYAAHGADAPPEDEAAAPAVRVPSEPLPSDSPFTDLAFPILDADQTLDDNRRSDLWQHFHESKSPAELVQRLMPLDVPEDTETKLWQAKQAATLPDSPVDKTVAAVQKLATMDKATLDLAESHKNV
jgi:hypothetical protein